MTKEFPRTDVGGVSLPRMIIGTNWLVGYSHKSPSGDNMIKRIYAEPDKFYPVFEAFLGYGIDAVLGSIGDDQLMLDAIAYAEDKTGKKLIIIDTPILNVSDTKEGRKEAEAKIKRSAKAGSTFCMPHHCSVEKLIDKEKGEIRRLGDYTSMVRDAGMVPGLSCHMPECIVYSDENGYDVETYIQLFNCLGFLMQVEIETIAAIIHNAKKPVLTIKPMAAGRTTPYVGLSFNFSVLRPIDMVAVGCFNADEVHEDVEISLAALERRYPNIKRRDSPANDQAAFGNK